MRTSVLDMVLCDIRVTTLYVHGKHWHQSAFHSKMLVLSLRQNRRLKSLLSLPNRTIIFQCQTRKFSALSKISGAESGRPDAEVSDDRTVPKRVDSPWKVGARVLAKGGVEDAVTDAFKMGLVMHRWSCISIL